MVITGIGLRLPFTDTLDGLYGALCEGLPRAGSTGTPPLDNIQGLVFADSLTKKVCAAALDAQKDGAVSGKRAGVFLGGGFGSLNSMNKYEDAIANNNRKSAMPMEFMNTVMNAPAGQLAIMFGAEGINLTAATGTRASMDALLYARQMMDCGRIDTALIGGAEELHRVYAEYLTCFGAVPSDGVCILKAERKESAIERGARIYAEILGGAAAYKPGYDEETAIKLTERAMCDAGICKNDIAFAVTSGSAPPGLGVDNIELNSVTGELCGAAGAVAAAAAVALAEYGPETDKAAALVNSFGFDGYMASVVIKIKG